MIQAFGLTSTTRKDLPPAVDDVSFDARAGHLTALLGAPGSGRTTVLRLMLELQQGRGITHFRGRPLHRIAHPSREVGVLLGDVPGHPARSVRGHLRMLCAAAGVPARRADEVLEVVGLVSLRGERLDTLSRAMDRRLGLGCALLADPHTLVLDDPADGLCQKERRWLYGMLRAHAAQGGTVLLTVTDPKDAARTADRVVTLDRGRVVADQDAAEFARTRLRPRVVVRTPHAARLAALLAREARTGRRSVEVVRESGNRLYVYGSTCADVGETAFRHGVLVHQLADETGDTGPVSEPAAMAAEAVALIRPGAGAPAVEPGPAGPAPPADPADPAGATLPGGPAGTAPASGPAGTAPAHGRAEAGPVVEPGPAGPAPPADPAGATSPGGPAGTAPASGPAGTAPAHGRAEAGPVADAAAEAPLSPAGAGAGEPPHPAAVDTRAGADSAAPSPTAEPRRNGPVPVRGAVVTPAAAGLTHEDSPAAPLAPAVSSLRVGTGTAGPRGAARRHGADARPALPPPLSVRSAPSPLRPLRYEVRRAAGVGTVSLTSAAVLVLSALTTVIAARIGHTPQSRLLAAWPQELPLPPAALGAGLLGALAFGDEFRHPALAADRGTVPRRLGLLAAKLLVAAATGLALAVLTVGCDAEVLYLVYGRELTGVPADWAVLGASWLALVVGCAWAGVLAAGIFRSTTAGLAAVVAVPVAVVPLVHRAFEGPAVRDATGFSMRMRELLLSQWPYGGERYLAGVVQVIAQPVGGALALTLTALLCAYLLTTLRGRLR